MIKVNREQAEGQLGRLIEAAAAGQDVVITIAGGPTVRLVPVLGNSAKPQPEADTERRGRFFAAVNTAYAELRSRKDEWKDLEAERSAWDSTLLDGLPAGEAWDEDGGTRGR